MARSIGEGSAVTMEAGSGRRAAGSRAGAAGDDGTAHLPAPARLRQADSVPRLGRWFSPSSASPSISSRPAAIPASRGTRSARTTARPSRLPAGCRWRCRTSRRSPSATWRWWTASSSPAAPSTWTRPTSAPPRGTKTVTTKDRRTTFELAITRAAHARAVPSLGICGGQQLMNVALGGSLIQHIPDTVPDALAHEQPNPRTEPGHAVSLEAGSVLRGIVGSATMQVNSAHHQAVADAAPGLVVNARAPDGVIEGIEDPAHCWFIGRSVAPGIRDRPRRRTHLQFADPGLRGLRPRAPAKPVARNTKFVAPANPPAPATLRARGTCGAGRRLSWGASRRVRNARCGRPPRRPSRCRRRGGGCGFRARGAGACWRGGRCCRS